MRQYIAYRLLALAATLAACTPDYEGGGRRPELPFGTTGGAAGATGAGGNGLSGSSDSEVDSGLDAGDLEDCPDAGYQIETDVVCATAVPAGTQCRRDDGAECVCRAETSAWDCG